jgi:hypothetical protein
MNVVMASLFRNSTGYLDRYLDQVAALRSRFDSFRLLAVEGDSKDHTRNALVDGARIRSLELELVTCNHNGPVFGSTEDPARMVQLSKVVDTVFENVHEDDDVLIYVESDLVWDVETMSRLIHFASDREDGFDVFAPLVFHVNGTFYDVWGFRKDGERFGHPPPYHRDFQPDSLMEMDSVGSCLAMRTRVARTCRVKNDYCLVGWCADAREHGFRIAAATNLRITHP